MCGPDFKHLLSARQVIDVATVTCPECGGTHKLFANEKQGYCPHCGVDLGGRTLETEWSTFEVAVDRMTGVPAIIPVTA